MKKVIIGFVCTLLYSNALAASGTLKGQVADSLTNAALSYINVSVWDKTKQVFITGSSTDEKGIFEIGNLPLGTYYVHITAIGYLPVEKDFSITETDTIVDFGLMFMVEDMHILDEVNIVAQRPQMGFEIDKKIFYVSQMLSASGGTALDVLADAPSVQVDPSGNILLRGDAKVAVWINGQASGMSVENRSRLLSQISATNIDRIEISTNPSARYNPEGTAGIINIILKGNRKPGYFGTIQNGADTRGGYNLSGNINYNTTKWETNASLSYRINQQIRNSSRNRTNLEDQSSSLSYINMISDGNERTQPVLGTLGLKYHFSHSTQIGLHASGMIERERVSETFEYSGNMPGSFLRSLRNALEEDYMRVGNLKLDFLQSFSEQSNLAIMISRNVLDLQGSNTFNQQSQLQAGQTTTTYQHQDQDVQIIMWEFQADYLNELGNSVKLEAGYKGDHLNRVSIIESLTGVAPNLAIPDPLLFNDFCYTQNVKALYATMSKEINKFSFQAGLRGEHSDITTRSHTVTENEADVPVYRSNYFNLFPSVNFAYKMGNGELQVDYSRRIARPHILMLNPYPDLMDSTNIVTGNPYLAPEFAHSFEINYLLKTGQHTFSSSLYYRRFTNIIQQVSYLDGSIMKSTFGNVTERHLEGVDFTGQFKFFDKLDITTNINLFHDTLTGFSYQPDECSEYIVANEQNNFAWNGRLTARTQLPYNLSLQVTGNYSSRNLIAQGYALPNASVDFGVRKSFLDNKLNLVFTGRNILDTRKETSITTGSRFHQKYMSSYGGRIFGLSLSYYFGRRENNTSINQNILVEDDED